MSIGFEPVLLFIGVIFLAVFGTIIYRLFNSITTKIQNDRSEVIEVRALVKDKRDSVSVYGVENHHTSTSTSYFVTFEFSDKSRKEFKVKDSQYGLLSVGDQGILNYQGTRFNHFERHAYDDRFDY